MDPLTLSLIATIAGSGLQMYSANQAAQRQQAAALDAQRRQLAARNQATQVAAKAANDFDPTQRQQNLADATQEQTQRFEGVNAQPAITAQGVQVGSTLPAGAGGGDYALAKARETAKTQASLHALAGLMGRMGGATELRRREAVKFGDAAGDVGRIQSGADNIAGIDQLGIEAAGRQNPWTQIAGAGLQAYGLNGLATAGLPKAAGPLTTGDFARMDRAGAWLR